MANGNSKTYPSLKENLAVDIAIIGGGLAGITAAYFLSRAGQRTAVLEQAEIGSGATSKTTAFLTQVIDTSLSDMLDMFGPEKTTAIWQSHGQAIEAVEQVIERENIDCGFMRCDNIYYANTDKELESLKKDFEAGQKLNFEMILSLVNDLRFSNEGYIKIPNQAKFSALEYLQGLAKVAKNQDAQIFEQTKVKKIKHDKEKFLLETNTRHTLTAKQVILATYHPLGNPLATFLKKGMYTSYVLGLEIPKELLAEGIYEDTANPYNYFRIDAGQESDSMVIGGQDHRSELKIDPAKGFRAVEAYVKKTFPDLIYKIKSKWTGPILEPIDGLPLIGEASPGQFVATAFSGNGMTYSTISGMLLCDLALGQRNSWQELYEPKRTPAIKTLIKKGKDYTEELFGGGLKIAFQ